MLPVLLVLLNVTLVVGDDTHKVSDFLILAFGDHMWVNIPKCVLHQIDRLDVAGVCIILVLLQLLPNLDLSWQIMRQVCPSCLLVVLALLTHQLHEISVAGLGPFELADDDAILVYHAAEAVFGLDLEAVLVFELFLSGGFGLIRYEASILARHFYEPNVLDAVIWRYTFRHGVFEVVAHCLNNTWWIYLRP
jgi:hypothetical protein